MEAGHCRSAKGVVPSPLIRQHTLCLLTSIGHFPLHILHACYAMAEYGVVIDQ